MPSLVKLVPAAVIVLAALLLAPPGHASGAAAEVLAAAPVNLLDDAARSTTGKSVVDQVSTTYAEEPPYSVPAIFPGPLAPQPRRKPETSAMLLACLGLMLYLGRRRSKALGAVSP